MWCIKYSTINVQVKYQLTNIKKYSRKSKYGSLIRAHKYEIGFRIIIIY